MLIQRILQVLVLAIVVVAAIGLLSFVLDVMGWLLAVALKVLVVLLIVAAVLRFVELLRRRQR